MLKKILRPLRTAIGRFALVPRTRADEIRDSIIYKAARLVAAEKVRGDYYEFGVFQGAHFCTAYRHIRYAFEAATLPGPWNTAADREERRRVWEAMRFRAFDSFEGLPEPVGPDAASRDFVKGKYAASQAHFEAALRANGVPMSRVDVVPGWFSESLTPALRQRLAPAAIVTVDCDLYESAKVVLDFMTPLLQPGTVIVFDDWFSFRGDPLLGEQRACAEWRALNPSWDLVEYQKEGPWRASFIVVPKRPTAPRS